MTMNFPRNRQIFTYMHSVRSLLLVPIACEAQICIIVTLDIGKGNAITAKCKIMIIVL